MSQSPTFSKAPSVDKRRRARAVLCAAAAIAVLGLAGGTIALPHLTSSLSDYDAPGSAVVLAQHEIQRATGANPEEGYEVVVRTAAPIGESSPLPTRVATVVGLLRARPEVKSVLDYANTGDRTMISKNGMFTVIVATVGAGTEGSHGSPTRHGGATVADGQHMARGAHSRRRPDRLSLVSRSWACRALHLAVPAPHALFRVSRLSRGRDSSDRCLVRHSDHLGCHGSGDSGRASLGLRAQLSNRAGIGARRRLQSPHRVALS